MAPPRPYWKSYLKLSLVSCPVAVYSAVSSGERVAFKQINCQTGHRLKQQLVDQILLGHTKIESTVRYVGVDVEDALTLAEGTELQRASGLPD